MRASHALFGRLYKPIVTLIYIFGLIHFAAVRATAAAEADHWVQLAVGNLYRYWGGKESYYSVPAIFVGLFTVGMVVTIVSVDEVRYGRVTWGASILTSLTENSRRKLTERSKVIFPLVANGPLLVAILSAGVEAMVLVRFPEPKWSGFTLQCFWAGFLVTWAYFVLGCLLTTVIMAHLVVHSLGLQLYTILTVIEKRTLPVNKTTALDTDIIDSVHSLLGTILTFNRRFWSRVFCLYIFNAIPLILSTAHACTFQVNSAPLTSCPEFTSL